MPGARGNQAKAIEARLGIPADRLTVWANGSRGLQGTLYIDREGLKWRPSRRRSTCDVAWDDFIRRSAANERIPAGTARGACGAVPAGDAEAALMPGHLRPPTRRQGEKKSSARKRWKGTGRCQMCGRKCKGRNCGACVAKARKRHGPPDRYPG